MKIKYFTILATLFLLPAVSMAQTPDDLDALISVNDQLLTTVQNADADGAAAYYTSDGVLLPPDGTVIEGTNAIRDYWTAGAGTKITKVRTRTIAGSVGARSGHLSGTYEMHVVTDEGDASVIEGTFLLAFERSESGWLIAQDMWTTSVQ